MKQLLRFTLAAVLFALVSATATALPGRAEVMKVVGQATVAKQGGSTASVTAGMVLGTGDTITTSAGSTVDLNLGVNGDFLRVEPDSSLKLENLDIANVAERTVTTQININRGGVTGNVVNKLSLASKYEIKSAGGVAGIRGTKYSVMTAGTPSRITRIVVTQGTVNFSQGGVTINIGAGQAYSPPATGPAVQANVGVPTAAETETVDRIAATIQQTGGNAAAAASGGDGVAGQTNPLNVSVSQ